MLDHAQKADVALLLDRPVWTALTTRHRRFGRFAGAAGRFHSDVSPFAVARDDRAESVAGLGALIGEGERAVLMQVGEIAAPASLRVSDAAAGVQMLAEQAFQRPELDAVRLGPADVEEMAALTKLTKPGPFEARTHELGTYWGVRRAGRLVAMAGERLKQPGFTEISAVCVHPEHQGRGYGAQLTRLAAAHICERGETPYLHTFADNTAAINLYEKLGFRLRSEVRIAWLENA